ncbi:Cu(I)/Ag(I) efflux system membrane fusion protein [Mucilaginibacter yixingensis]|uniref:Cu(I)/Ag(I) efflux system membrane fusion protein n=1 Tax=Mucilaginibacter yixingensis TaxID=1295612 RepID=A0A2T5JDA0_9SPHI|nr:efflux RND transporter periplasmic adaptor subunit [Mucilaginibacter yixingensis]PTQ99733.1 Cu(I)/Ag(I) efflux system membrane fusion protein [Mucilaginibacter yixingensis]
MNKYKRYQTAGLLLLIVIVALSACKQREQKAATQTVAKSRFYYTCSMHPQVHEDHPGNCPVCGMKLIKAEAGGDSQDNRIKLTAAQQQLAGIQTDTVREQNTGDEKLITGTVTADENASGEQSARLAGRIQHLYVRTVGETIKIGQPVYSLYSEDLQEAQKEYLLAKEQQQKLHNPDVDYPALISAAESKLKLWGLTAGQIAALARSGKVSASAIIVSTVNGTVSELNVHEGDYVSEGMTILKTQGLGSLWVEAQLYVGEAGTLQPGQVVDVVFPDLGGQLVKGKVTFMNPELSDGSKIDLVRISVINPKGELRPGMQANVALGGKGINLAVPVTAVLTDGKGSHVWVKNTDGSFSPRMVEIGKQNHTYAEVTSGLNSGEVIVSSGAYLLNSESVFKNGSDMVGMEMR